MAINFEHLLILCGEPPGHCRPQRHATQRPQRYNRGKEKTSPRDGFFALTPTMAQDRTEPGPPRATATGRHRRRPTARSHAQQRPTALQLALRMALAGLSANCKGKKHDDMWVYSANCNVYFYIYIAVGTNPRVVIDCKWHKAHCSVMTCHAAPPAADECASPTAGAWAGASRVKASVHPTAFRPEATAPPVGVFLTNPRGFSYGCNNSHCYCRRHLFSSTHGKIGCRSHGKTLFNITAH